MDELTSDLPKASLSPRTDALAAASAAKPGMLIAGRYRVEGLLGRGGVGFVHRVSDVRTGQQVALKRLRVSDDQQRELTTSLRRLQSARSNSESRSASPLRNVRGAR